MHGFSTTSSFGFIQNVIVDQGSHVNHFHNLTQLSLTTPYIRTFVVVGGNDPTFNFDIGPESPFGVLNVQILDEDDNLVYPDNGDQWLQMIGRPSDVIDLSSIPTKYDRLRVRVYLESDGTEPWEDTDPPSMVFGFRTLPYLTE